MESLIPDPVRLIKLALEFKELLERIGENDEECRDIWNLAQSTGSLVMKLQEERPDLIHDTVMANVLLGVESALIWASDIVEKQRKQGTLRKYTSSKTMARNFRRARDRIDSHIDMLNAAINIHNLVDVRQKHYSECPLLQFEGARVPDTSSTSHITTEARRGNARTSSSSKKAGGLIPAAASSSSASRTPPPLASTEISRPIQLFEKLQQFDFATLAQAANGFLERNEIDRFRSTITYRGHLDGRDVAIKRFDCPLSLEYVPGFFELAKLDHVNVIKYLGCCIEEETILVYEYNKDARIDAFFCGRDISWTGRFNIINGIAEGIAYIHENFSPNGASAFLGDLMPRDIAMDSKYNPKISNIGISRILERSAEAATRRLSDIGYRAPEFVLYGVPSVKADIYSFGLIALEILSGMNFFGTLQPINDPKLVNRPRQWFEQMKSRLGPELRNCVKGAIYCVNEDPTKRPGTMKEVLDVVNGKVEAPTWV